MSMNTQPEEQPTSRVEGEAPDVQEMPAQALGRSAQARPEEEPAAPEDTVEEASVDSFPASDPPAF
jgi:hypothetical protein